MFYRLSRNITLAAILVLLTGVQPSVTFTSQSHCVVTGSTVKIPCTFAKPDNSSVTKRQWYRIQRSEGEPRDLSKDPQYSGRVSLRTRGTDCDLTLRNVRVSDSGVYNFRFKTQTSDWISASSGVLVNVTDLQVKVDPNTVGQKEVTVTCSSICRLTSYSFKLYWYRNGEFEKIDGASIVLDSTSPFVYGNYSCQLYDSDHRSPPVCVLGKACWGVTYTRRHVCALKDTSIDVSCSYKHPAGHTVIKSMWFIKKQANAKAVDVTENEEYQGRVQHIQNSQDNCSLRITNLTERDAQKYRFRFYTNQAEYTGKAGVTLSVTDLKVLVSDTSSGQKQLSCITTCRLSNNPTYTWYKNGQHVSNCKSAVCSVSVVSGPISYSCAVEGHDSLVSPPVYSPKNTRAVVLPSGDTVEGDSVTLSCSSDANPPVLNFTWFKQTAAADTLLTTGQNYSITNIRTNHSGLYYCTAHNLLGHHNSTLTHLDFSGSEENPEVKFIMMGLLVFLALIFLSGALWMWKRKSSSAIDHCSSGDSGQPQSAAVYENIPVSESRRVASDDQNSFNYRSVFYKDIHTQKASRSPRLPSEVEEVQYAVVNLSTSSAAIRFVGDLATNDPSQIYSNIQNLPISSL